MEQILVLCVYFCVVRLLPKRVERTLALPVALHLNFEGEGETADELIQQMRKQL